MHPQVHLFAIITDDFRRMQSDRFAGFPKPVLSLDGGVLHPVGVPVPPPGLGPLIERTTRSLRTLRSYALLDHFAPSADGRGVPDASATRAVAHAALRDMAVRDSLRGTSFVVVYLPTIDDYRGRGADPWRRWLAENAAKGDYQVLDLVPDLRRVPPDSIDALFIPRGQLSFRAAAFHYTEAGNRWVQRQSSARIPALGGR